MSLCDLKDDDNLHNPHCSWYVNIRGLSGVHVQGKPLSLTHGTYEVRFWTRLNIEPIISQLIRQDILVLLSY